MVRSRISTFLELAGAASVTAGAASLTNGAVGLVVAGGFALLFGYRMGNE